MTELSREPRYTCPECGKVMPAAAKDHHRCPDTVEFRQKTHLRLCRLLWSFDPSIPDELAVRIIAWAKSGWKGDP